MKGQQRLVGVEFNEMAEILFPAAKIEGRMLAIDVLREKLREITTGGPDAFKALKKTKDIDHALPRLVVAVAMMEAFGYTHMELTEREVAAGLIIEAGLR